MNRNRENFKAFVENVLQWTRVPKFEEMQQFYLNLTRGEMESTQAALREFDPELARLYDGQVAALQSLYDSAAAIHTHLKNKTENKS